MSTANPLTTGQKHPMPLFVHDVLPSSGALFRLNYILRPHNDTNSFVSLTFESVSKPVLGIARSDDETASMKPWYDVQLDPFNPSFVKFKITCHDDLSDQLVSDKCMITWDSGLRNSDGFFHMGKSLITDMKASMTYLETTLGIPMRAFNVLVDATVPNPQSINQTHDQSNTHSSKQPIHHTNTPAFTDATGTSSTGSANAQAEPQVAGPTVHSINQTISQPNNQSTTVEYTRGGIFASTPFSSDNQMSQPQTLLFGQPSPTPFGTFGQSSRSQSTLFGQANRTNRFSFPTGFGFSHHVPLRMSQPTAWHDPVYTTLKSVSEHLNMSIEHVKWQDIKNVSALPPIPQPSLFGTATPPTSDLSESIKGFNDSIQTVISQSHNIWPGQSRGLSQMAQIELTHNNTSLRASIPFR